MVNFSKEQIKYMRSIGLGYIDFGTLTDDDDYWLDIEETVADHLTFDEEGEPTGVTLMCESILDMLPVD